MFSSWERTSRHTSTPLPSGSRTVQGEDVGKLGGVFRITDGLQKDFGEDRVIDTPLAESGVVGTAIGLALRGYRPVVEIQFDGFVFPAYDQIVTQLAKMHARALGEGQAAGRRPHPVRRWHRRRRAPAATPRPSRARRGPEGGLAVQRERRLWMMQQAVQSDDPVIFFEPKRRYWDKGEVDTESSPARCTGP
ncbi:Alpha-ketoacid dehydrogenase subunit beta OS=Streptomyces anulatus OX=1892 GN=G3I43_06030 PE=4 SV=1 [Streptomyces griseus subsp. griseus]